MLPPGTYEFAAAPTDATVGATTSLEVTGERPQAVETFVAPANAVDPDDSPATVAANLTQRDDIAFRDVVALDFEDGLDDDASIAVERRAGDETWTLDDAAVQRHDNDRTIVTVDTEELGDAEWVSGDYDLVVETDGETAAGSFTVEPRWVSTVAPSDTTELLYPTEETTITAATNVAPGSEVFFSARSRSPDPFLQDATVTVDENGTARAEFDFADRNSGNEFSVTARELETGTESVTTARFVEDAGGVDRSELTTIPAGETTTVAGFQPRTSVTVWRNDDGERDELVGRAAVDDDGLVELHPGLTASGESYALVDDSGSTVGTVTTVRSSVEPYVNDEGVVETDGLIDAIEDWADGAIDTELVAEIIDYWQSDTPVGQ